MVKVSEIERPVEIVVEKKPISIGKKRSILFSFWQLIRFGIVGTLNTLLDALALNLLLLIFVTHDAQTLIICNSLAYTLGALNSFILNKYWTFERRLRPTFAEIGRFVLVNIIGVICNGSIFMGVALVLLPVLKNDILSANIAKVFAVAGTMLISYLGMRLWVFAVLPREHWKKESGRSSSEKLEVQEQQIQKQGSMKGTMHSLSIIMPAHNEEVAIADTVCSVVSAVEGWTHDFEVIVVNDGSKDRTRAILEEIAADNARVRVINHEVNRGYGAALVSGFESITKDLAFFMDSDGQFDINDLMGFFPLIEQYDAVLGYRVDRQDTWVRKLNAWGWKMLVQSVFQLRVRDVDCAFKLYRSRFFHEHRLETRGAMINTEILYKFKRAGYTYTQVGVRHLPRHGGRATGAKLSVIARAFRELFIYARKWHKEELEERKALK